MAGSEFPSIQARSSLDLSGGVGIVRYDLTESEYIGAFDEFSVAKRYRLVDVRGYEVDGLPHYAAIWERDDAHPGHASRHAITRDELAVVAGEFAAGGLRPVRLSAYVAGARTLFAGIWELAGGPERQIHWDVPAADLHAHAEQARDAGYRIIDLSGYAPPTAGPGHEGASLLASIWEAGEGPGWAVTGPVDAEGHQRDFDRLTADGWRPVRTDAWPAGRGGTRFATLWQADTGVIYDARSGFDSDDLADGLSSRDSEGLRLEQLGAYPVDSGGVPVARFCPLWTRRDADQVIPPLVAAFARDYDVPGVALAVARHGRLVHTSGHGVADPAGGRPVSARHSLFRIASISKPITSAAVMQSAARGLITLDDPVFGPDGHLTGILGGPPADPRAAGITVRHLLQHACGGWAGDDRDPMFTLPERSATELIDTVVRSRRLEHDPGTHYAYSNFGYCLLGRLIEKITGTAYEEHVRGALLAGCGITAMHVARDGRQGRRPAEVTYDDQDGYDPYALPVRRMDAHGGWLASAVDLLRFAVRVDGSGTVPGVLEPRWVTEMSTVPDLVGCSGYAAGWGVHDDGTRSHAGRLPGTSTMLALTPDGLCVALLTNASRACDPPDPAVDTLAGLNQLFGAIRDRVDFWPAGSDL
ncbi:MAG TPA: serine hydrolase [Pseudonocardia sp.]|nr:serine hydrolase [Pseudonocardia sp.]